MVDSATARTFTDSFMRSFSFVDDINQRRRRNRLLEEEIEDRRRRADRQERIQDEELAFSNSERNRVAELRRRTTEANRLIAEQGPNIDKALLEPYLDIPEVQQLLVQRGELDADVEALSDIYGINGRSGGNGLSNQVTGGQAPAAQAPAPGQGGGLAGQVRGAALPSQLPGDRFAEPVSPTETTTLDLERMAEQDPQAAMAARTARNAANAQNKAGPGIPLDEQRALRVGGKLVVETPEQRARRNRNAGRDQLQREWDMFNDIENPEGDEFRNLPAGAIVGQYARDRNSIGNPEIVSVTDRRMAPYINRSVAAASAVLNDPNASADDIATARRHMNDAVNVTNAMQRESDVFGPANVDARGVPNNNANPQLTQTVIDQAAQTPGSVLAPPADQQRADAAVVNRGSTSPRLSKKFVRSAVRLYRNGRLTQAQFDSLMRTGKLPVQAPEIRDIDPTKDLVRIWPDGTVQILRHGRKPPLSAAQLKELNKYSSGRNILEDTALEHVQDSFDAFNTDDEPARGNAMMNSFMQVLHDNEQFLTSRGRDMTNILDVNWAMNRYLQMFEIRDTFNDRWFYDGDFLPEFQDHFGSLSQAFASDELDEAVATGELEGNLAPVPPPVSQGRIGNPQMYDEIRALYPDTYGTLATEESNRRIEADLQTTQQRRGR